MKNKSSSYFLLLFSFILGGISSLIEIPYCDAITNNVSFLFLRILELIALPILFLSIVTISTSINSVIETRPYFFKTIKYSLVTTLFSSLSGLLIFTIVNPSESQTASERLYQLPETYGYIDYLKNLVPQNIFAPFYENNPISVGLIAFVFSIAITKLPNKQRKVLQMFFTSCYEAFFNIAKGLVSVSSIAIFSFSYLFFKNVISTTGEYKNLVFFIVTITVAHAVHTFLFLPLLLKFHKIQVLRHTRKIIPALIVGFFSKSSSSALPLTIRCCREMGLRKTTSQITLPVCSLINMNGCAAFVLITILFISNQAGLSFSLGELVLLVVLSVFAALGNSGMPMGSYMLTSTILISLNLDLKLFGIILPVYMFMDMVETSINIFSSSCIAAIVDKEMLLEEQKKEKILASSSM